MWVWLPVLSTLAALSEALLSLFSVMLVLLLGGILATVVSRTLLDRGDSTSAQHATCSSCGAQIQQDQAGCPHCGRERD